MGSVRNGSVSVEFQVAMRMRCLAGGVLSVYELMKEQVIGESAADAIVCRIVDVVIAQHDLGCVWPDVSTEEASTAESKRRGTYNEITRALECFAGLFIRARRLASKEHA